MVQVLGLQYRDTKDMVSTTIYLLVVATLAAIPTVLLNAPVGLVAHVLAEK